MQAFCSVLREFARLNALDESGPLVGGEGQRSDLRVLRVANENGVRGLCDLDTGVGAAVPAHLPLIRLVDVHLRTLDLPSRRTLSNLKLVSLWNGYGRFLVTPIREFASE